MKKQTLEQRIIKLEKQVERIILLLNAFDNAVQSVINKEKQ